MAYLPDACSWSVNDMSGPDLSNRHPLPYPLVGCEFGGRRVSAHTTLLAAERLERTDASLIAGSDGGIAVLRSTLARSQSGDHAAGLGDVGPDFMRFYMSGNIPWLKPRVPVRFNLRIAHGACA